MVVIAALFIAFSVIAAVAIERNSATQLISRRDSAAQQLTRISNALIEYSVANISNGTLYYPCPALETILTSSASFGAASTGCSSTAGDVVGPPATTASGLAILGTNVIRGMVPVQDLAPYGVTLNDAFDPWNNRIAYVVNRRLTKGSAATAASSQGTNPTVTHQTTGTLIAPPDFILLSYGRDGIGAFRRGKTSVDIACPTASAVLRLHNCGVSTNFYVAPTNTGSAATGATYFDDVLTYYRQ